jgi:hypothetical protein
MSNSKAGMFEMPGMAADRAGNAWHGDHSTDQFGANNLDTVATANSADIANTAGAEHPRMDRSTGHIPAPEGWGRIRQADQKLQSPR